MSERFDSIARKQRHNACAPTSLSSCLAILGIDATPEKVARLAGVPLVRNYPGLDEHQLMAAARTLGVTCRPLEQTRKTWGRSWARSLLAHVRKGFPAVLLVKDFKHWVAVCGYVDERYIVMDGLEDQRNYNLWNRTTLLRHAWNEDPADDSEPDQYYALLLRRPDGKVRWRLNQAYLDLGDVGSVATAEEMANDLVEMALRASGRSRAGRGARPLAQVLERRQDTVLDTVDHWVAYRDGVTKRELRSLLGAYVTIAATTGVRLPASADETELLTQLTAILSAYGATGSLAGMSGGAS